MLDIFKEFATEEKLELQGAWKELGEAKFLIGRSRNDNYMKLYVELQDLNRDVLLKGGDSAEKLNEQIMYEVIARTVLLGWEKVAYKGKPLTYSTENAIKLLQVKDFYRVVSGWSNDIANYRAAIDEAEAGN